jgi:membrane protein implicated in regulation of membrane protease activity
MKHSLWLVWTAVALGAGILEVTTLHLVFIMFAGGALAAAGVALVHGPPVAQALTFGLVSTALLGVVRPLGLRWMRSRGPDTVTGVAALIGRPAEVISEVTGNGGQVKLAGEFWTARWEGQGALPIGTAVLVTSIDGATAVVAPAPGALPQYGAAAGDLPPPVAQDPPAAG